MDPEQAAAFLAASSGDPLHLLFRIVLLAGARRGEAVGLRWSGADLDAGYLRVGRSVLLIGAHVVDSTPRAGPGPQEVAGRPDRRPPA